MPTRQPLAALLRAAALAAIFASACGEPPVTAAVSPPLRPSLSFAVAGMPVELTDRHLFMMHGHSIPDGFAAEVAAAGGTVVRLHPEIGAALVRGLSNAAAEALARGRGFVERDVRFRALPTPREFGGVRLADVFPADVDAAAAKSPLSAAALALQWNMRQIQAPQAWASRPAGDRRVRVAIIDSGLDPDHTDQEGLIDVASSRAFTPSVSGPPEWADDHYHGTYVGGQVVTNNVIVAGVAPEVSLIAIKIFNAAGQTSGADLIAGIIHAGNVRADVANLSLGGYLPKTGAGLLVALVTRAVNYANQRDVLVVSAAGNENIDLQHDRNNVALPCEAGTGICISATGPTDTKASYSNYGVPAIDVAAPGGDAGPPGTHLVLGLCSSRSVIPALAFCKPRGWYFFAAGTSGAAPHVSGAAAYLDSQYGGALNPAQLETALEQCSDDIGKPGTEPFYGRGRINVFKTVNQIDCSNRGDGTSATPSP